MGRATADTRQRANGSAQAKRHAQRARSRAAKRRDEASGAAGWVADRAAQWSLDGPDYAFMERQKYLWNPLIDYWFRMETEGWEKLPDPPALLIGIHSGAPFVWDAWTVGLQWWRRSGDAPPLHAPPHDPLMAAPGIGGSFRRMGVLPAASDRISAALAERHD